LVIGTYLMPRQDYILHIATEIIAVLLLAPYLVYTGFTTDDYLLVIIGVLTIGLDGYLLYKWAIELTK